MIFLGGGGGGVSTGLHHLKQVLVLFVVILQSTPLQTAHLYLKKPMHNMKRVELQQTDFGVKRWTRLVWFMVSRKSVSSPAVFHLAWRNILIGIYILIQLLCVFRSVVWGGSVGDHLITLHHWNLLTQAYVLEHSLSVEPLVSLLREAHWLLRCTHCHTMITQRIVSIFLRLQLSPPALSWL